MSFYGPDHLPYPLASASVTTNNSQSLAIITGGEAYWNGWASDQVIIYTNQTGFYVLENFSMNTRRYGHISLRIE